MEIVKILVKEKDMNMKNKQGSLKKYSDEIIDEF